MINVLKKFVLIVVASLVVGNAAAQQIPPHPPGSICFTQYFWCWLPALQVPGSVCMCPSPYGWVYGRAN